MSWWTEVLISTHRSRLSRLCAQRSTATPLLSWRAAGIFQVRLHSIAWGNSTCYDMSRHTSIDLCFQLISQNSDKNSLNYEYCPPKDTVLLGWLRNMWLYLRPILMTSSGEQGMVSGQLGDLCCLLSRNHPESTRPRTWASAPSCATWLATLSIFSKTPAPPALQGSQENQLWGF